jgi:hypothetical protein
MYVKKVLRFTIHPRVCVQVSFFTVVFLVCTVFGSSALLRIKAKKALAGYQNGICCMSLSPQNILYVVARGSSKIDVWDLAGFKRVQTLEGHQGKIRSISVSDSGQLVVSSADDNSVRVWPVGTQKDSVVLQGPERGVTALAVSFDDQLVAGAADDDAAEIWLWKLGSEEKPRLLKNPGTAGGVLKEAPKGVRQMKFSPDGRTLAAVTDDGSLITWSIETGNFDRIYLQLPDRLQTVDFNSHGAILASGKSFQISISMPSGKVDLLELHGSVLCVPPDGEEKEFADSSSLIVEGAYWLADGQHFFLYASKGFKSPPDRFLRLVELSSVRTKQSLKGMGEIKLDGTPLDSSLEVSRDGSIVVQETQNKVLVWQLEVEVPKSIHGEGLPPSRPTSSNAASQDPAQVRLAAWQVSVSKAVWRTGGLRIKGSPEAPDRIFPIQPKGDQYFLQLDVRFHNQNTPWSESLNSKDMELVGSDGQIFTVAGLYSPDELKFLPISYELSPDGMDQDIDLPVMFIVPKELVGHAFRFRFKGEQTAIFQPVIEDISTAIETPAKQISDLAVLPRIESYRAPSFPRHDSIEAETYDYRLKFGVAVPPTLVDVLVCDLWRTIHDSPSGKELQPQNVTARDVLAAIHEYLNTPWIHLAGYRPWTHSNFFKSLEPEEIQIIALEIVDYIRRFGIQDVQ